MTLKLRAPVPFPARVSGNGGIVVNKTNGEWIIEPDFSALQAVSATSVSDPSLKQIWIYDPLTEEYSVLTLAGLGNALYRMTSTTSLAIGTGSKTFTTQTNKDVAVGSWVLALSDADESNFMLGQVTAYADGALTISVPASGVGGSGTHSDWTIISSGAPGASGAPGIRQTFNSETTDADPGAGQFKLNHATPSSATAAYLDNLDLLGATVSGIIDRWDDSTNTTKGTLRFDKIGDPTVWAEFAVTGSVVDGTGYRKLTLSSGASSGTFAGDFAISFFAAGNVGAQGTPGAGDVSGPSSSVDGEAVLFDSTTGKLIKRSTLTGMIKQTSGVPAAATDGTDYLSSSTGRKQGKETIWIPAGAMVPRLTNGPSVGTVEMSSNKNMFKTLDFDTATQEFAQFEVFFPKSWNLGTVTFQPVWSHASTTTNFGVVFGLAGVARSDDDAGDVAFGTAQTSTDTGGTTNDIYIGPESSAITIAGTPAAGDTVQFQINRTVADASDTMAVDARLHGIRLFFTTNAATDA